MQAFIYKFKLPLSIYISFLVCCVILFFIKISLISIVCCLFYLTSLSFTFYSLIKRWLDDKIVKKTYVEKTPAILISTIKIKEIESIKIATFKMKSNTYLFEISLESQNGNNLSEYTQLNIDYIMIKPEKRYFIYFEITEGFINSKKCLEMRNPVAIEYYNLKEKFCLFKEKSYN